MFYDRERDLADLNDILTRPGAQLMIVSGRRRVGKTTLLIEWARRSGRPFLYWVASRQPAPSLLQSISQTLWRYAHPNDIMPASFAYDSWSEVFQQMAILAAEQRLIVILDELTYVIEVDDAFTSLLQNAWDHHIKQTQICLLLAGSHIGLMNQLHTYRAPLYGRFTAQLRLDPLPFYALRSFLPGYDAERRVAVYAILGGIPAYLEQFSDQYTLRENLERTILRRTGLFRTEPFVLIGDLVREPRNYTAIIRAIADNRHTPEEIAASGAIAASNVHKYLQRLVELQLVERRLPATVPPKQRTTQSRYYLRDPFLRFYYRFLEPNQDLIELELKDALWQAISEQMRAFIGLTAFEDLCREWTLMQARRGQLAFVPQMVSGYWGQTVQVDVVALSWRVQAVLLGECKWGAEAVPRSVISDLLEVKTPRLLALLPEAGAGWAVHHVVFARAGFTPAASTLATAHNVRLVDLPQLDSDLTPV